MEELGSVCLTGSLESSSLAIAVIILLPDAPDICALTKTENVFLASARMFPVVMFWFCPCPAQPQEPPDPAEEGEAGIHPGGARTRAVPSPHPRWWVPHLGFHCWEITVALGGLHSFCLALVFIPCQVTLGFWHMNFANSSLSVPQFDSRSFF